MEKKRKKKKGTACLMGVIVYFVCYHFQNNRMQQRSQEA